MYLAVGLLPKGEENKNVESMSSWGKVSKRRRKKIARFLGSWGVISARNPKEKIPQTEKNVTKQRKSGLNIS